MTGSTLRSQAREEVRRTAQGDCAARLRVPHHLHARSGALHAPLWLLVLFALPYSSTRYCGPAGGFGAVAHEAKAPLAKSDATPMAIG
jgi:hypothetical protein